MKPLAVYGAQIPIEGDNPPDAVVVLEFPTVEDAKAWYYSPEYQEAAKHRLAAADYRGVIVEGYAEQVVGSWKLAPGQTLDAGTFTLDPKKGAPRPAPEDDGGDDEGGD